MVERIVFIVCTILKFRSQLGINVTWHDAYCQQHDDTLKMKFIFNYQMPYPNIKKLNKSIDSDDEVNDPHPTNPVINVINIEH